MRFASSFAAVLVAATLCGGGQAGAMPASTASPKPLDVPSLFTNLTGAASDELSLQSDSLERLALDARVASVGNLDIVASLDPIGLSGAQDSANYSGLFHAITLANSPYVLLSGGGRYYGSSIALADNIHARFGAFAIDPTRPQFGDGGFSYFDQVEGQQAFYQFGQSRSGVAAVDWDFSSWGALGLIATQTTEQNGLLSGFNAGGLAAGSSAKMSTVGMSARVGFGDGWVTTLSYNEGITQLALRPNVINTGADALHSRAYGFAVAKHGLFDDNDSLGVALTRPLQVYSGGTNFTADGFDTNIADIKLAHQFSSLASATPETDFELGYVTTFWGGAIALQTNAGYQMNVDGFGGTNALSVISRAKINF